MTIRLSTVCLLCVSAIVASARPLETDISGTWAFTVKINGEDWKSTFVFKQEGEKLSGSYTGPLGPASVTGSVKGDSAVFSFTGKNNQGESATVDYRGRIESATRMTGTMDFHKGPTVEFTATRTAPEKSKDTGS